MQIVPSCTQETFKCPALLGLTIVLDSKLLLARFDKCFILSFYFDYFVKALIFFLLFAKVIIAFSIIWNNKNNHLINTSNISGIFFGHFLFVPNIDCFACETDIEVD